MEEHPKIRAADIVRVHAAIFIGHAPLDPKGPEKAHEVWGERCSGKAFMKEVTILRWALKNQ